MSHELRTPLNSMLILSRLLAENGEGNLSTKQIEFAQTIHLSGADLLTLINDVLDIAKIESGTMAVEIDEVLLTDVGDYVDRSFRQVAQAKALDFTVEFDSRLPRAV